MDSQLSRRGFLAMAAGAAAAPALAACSSGSGSDGKVEITVMGMPPTTQQVARKRYQARVKEFEKLNPTIKVTPSDEQWDARTFATKLAGGTATVVIDVPMTEPPGLIDRGQVADITAEARKLSIFSSYDPRVLGIVTRAGKVYGLPRAAYSLGLAYNRELFTKAGLDPDAPPSTWDDLRAAAKTITTKTGVPGFGEMSTNNTGGWHLTAATYTRGGVMERKQGKGYVPAFNDAPTRDALSFLSSMRWDDKSMGTNQLRNQPDLIKAFASGKVAMFVSAPDLYGLYLQQYKGDPKVLGMGSMPQGNGNATLLGGSVMMVNSRATPQQQAAAMKFIDHMSLRPLYDTTIAAENAKADAADKSPVGVPAVPIFSKSVQAKVDAAIKPYVNVPLANFAPYVAGDAKLNYQAEPPVAAQDLYAALDSVVQAVLTKRGTDVAGALSGAEAKVAAVLKRQQ
ncbi:ABC transporter substrate-binding protein [Actinocatenispora rupis]|uniref:Sugar ABC transporter substrate-binding protein n=1 Tax=Actinocatenispora rupis TaxID=519421 RepID=A0A8J3NAU1_9ACTN|nr:extracellular solute-binding protein [Actinocatenispora rupis]GID10055.1 sugar ABC transporter substrate-binding protein [Actinocatenispora rupis]